jgi:hypothetical protein
MEISNMAMVEGSIGTNVGARQRIYRLEAGGDYHED